MGVLHSFLYVAEIIPTCRILKPDGTRLKATGFKDWLRSRGLFMECLCPLVLEIGDRDPISCRLVVSKANGDVLAFCHQEENGCGMRGENLSTCGYI